MKRSGKNILFILIIIIMGVCSYFTMRDVGGGKTKDLQEPNFEENAKEMTGQQGNPPKKLDEDNQMQAPPEKPDGENEMQTPPEKPDGGNEMQAPSEKSNGENEMQAPPDMPDDMNGKIKVIHYIMFGIEALVISLLIIYLGMSQFHKLALRETFSGIKRKVCYLILTVILTVLLTVTQIYITGHLYIGMNSNNQNREQMMPGNQVEMSSEITGKTEITQDSTISSGTYTSTEKDEVAILLNGDTKTTLSDIAVTKTGDSDSGDSTSFYGTNSAILAKEGANITLKNLTIKTEANGANGVFCFGGSATTNNASGDGTTVTICDSDITTTKDNSGGIMTTGGGNMKASNLTVNTAGTSSAAIRTDRGGGAVTVDGGTYTTTGQGSPAIYSTADITVKDSTLVSKSSEGIVIEGKNNVTIENCDLTDSNTKLNGKSTTYKNIFLYQSMSGDAAEGNAEFTANNSTITTNNGDSFYVTNTTATINLNRNTILNNDSSGNLLRVKADSWGKSGSNGGNVTLNATKQELLGNIVIDDISTLELNLKEGSTFEGTINGDNTAKSIKLNIDDTSVITLTGDTYVTELEDSDTSYSNINFNGYKLFVNGTSIH